MHYKSLRLPFLCSILGLLMLLLAACNSSTTLSGITNTTHLTAMQSALVTTSTSCPTPGNGRAAILPPLTGKQHQSVVYLSQKNTSTVVSKYDTKTGKKKDLFTFFNPNNSSVETSISPDGHWVTITLLRTDGSSVIQLVRIDGSYAQTLYCSKGTDFVSGVLLSPDQHHLAFNETDQNTQVTTLKVLDTTTGQISIELSSQQPGYPNELTLQRSVNSPVYQATRQESPTQAIKYSVRLMPQPGPRPNNAYIPIRWASKSSIYLLQIPTIAGSGSLPHQIYQLLDINKHVDQQSSNVKSIAASLQQNGCFSDDISSDQTQLICSTGPAHPMDPTKPSVNVEPISGGTLQTIFNAPTNSQVLARAAQGKTILFTVDNGGTSSQLYRVQTNGTGLKLLTSTNLPDIEYSIERSGSEFLPWTNASFDGKQYTVESLNVKGENSLIIGSMNGGTTTTIATHILTLVGWTAA